MGSKTRIGLRLGGWLGALCLLLVAAGSASAAVTEVRVFFDVDADPGTGCSATTSEGAFSGVESLLRFDFDWTTGEVVDAASQTCTVPATSTFSSPTAISEPQSPPWTIAPGQGVGGATAVEAYVPVAMLPGVTAGSVVRLGVASSTVGGDDALLTADGQPGGPDILAELVALIAVPTGSVWTTGALMVMLGILAVVVLRRAPGVARYGALGLLGVLVAAGAARAAGVLDGLVDDWEGVAAAGTDATGDAGTGADIVGVWVRVDLAPPTGGGPGFGVISGDVGVLAGETTTVTPSQFDTVLDFGIDPFTEPDDVALLTADAQVVHAATIAGGSSRFSEVFSMETLARGEGAVLLATEDQVVYDVGGGPTIDLLVEIDGTPLGVAVTRAITFPTGGTVSVATATSLIEPKLDDLLVSRANVAVESAFAKGILHVFVENQSSRDNVVTALAGIAPATLADTIVLVTVTEGDDLWLFGF